MFEKAARTKLRFQSQKGMLSVEDLWDLKLTDLDLVARNVNKKLKEEGEESFIEEKTSRSASLELSLEILKYIIATKKKEKQDIADSANKEEKKELLKALLKEKEVAKMKDMTPEEIQAEIDKLS